MTVIEGFETISGTGPWTSNYEWFDFTFAGLLTVTRTTSHVTQGTYTWRVQKLIIQGQSGLSTGSDVGAATVDLSGATSLSVDLYGVTTPTNTKYSLQVYDADFNLIEDSTTTGFTGADTLTVDLTTLAGSLSSCQIFLNINNDGSLEGPYDVYFDNMQADLPSAAGWRSLFGFWFGGMAMVVAGGAFQAAWARNSNTILGAGNP